MTENQAAYLTAEERERLQTEACALAHVCNLATDERPDACAKLSRAAFAAPAWLGAVRREMEQSPAADLAALWGVLERAALESERDKLKAVGVDLDTLQTLDPANARAAYEAALDGAERAGVLACMRSARQMLDDAEQADSEPERRALVLDAVHELTRPEADGDKPLSAAWDAHLERMAASNAGRDEVLKLDPKRGPWGEWFNQWLGPRGGLEPGETFILGGAPEAGKTSIAALLAVDALAVDCPVTFWQLELNREETLEHMQAQRPDLNGWPAQDFWSRARGPLPTEWENLLTVPRWPEPEAESIIAALHHMARQAERARKNGTRRHKCNGLLVVDYAQLLTVADKNARESRFEVLEKSASRLAKAAAEAGACLLLLSQMNKADQSDGRTAGTALAGADLARMAHRVALVQKADAQGHAIKAGEDCQWDATKGEARVVTWTKARGVAYTDGRRPDNTRKFWNGGRSRALHGGDDMTAGGFEA